MAVEGWHVSDRSGRPPQDHLGGLRCLMARLNRIKAYFGVCEGLAEISVPPYISCESQNDLAWVDLAFMTRTHMNHYDEIHAPMSEFGLTHTNMHFIVIQMHHETSKTVQVSPESN